MAVLVRLVDAAAPALARMWIRQVANANRRHVEHGLGRVRERRTALDRGNILATCAGRSTSNWPIPLGELDM
jgi:hypothetical protein